MALAIPVFRAACCLPCVAGVRGGGRVRVGELGASGEAALAGSEIAALTMAEAGERAAVTSVAGARVAPEAAAVVLLQAVVAERRPVWAEARCGTDRDCISNADWQSSFDVAVAGSAGWVNKEPSRFVVIRDRPGGVMLTQVGPLGGGAGLVVGATRALGGLAVARQEQLVRGR